MWACGLDYEGNLLSLRSSPSVLHYHSNFFLSLNQVCRFPVPSLTTRSSVAFFMNRRRLPFSPCEQRQQLRQSAIVSCSTRKSPSHATIGARTNASAAPAHHRPSHELELVLRLLLRRAAPVRPTTTTAAASEGRREDARGRFISTQAAHSDAHSQPPSNIDT